MRYLKFANLFAPKAGAQHELLLNKPVSEVGLSNIKSDLGVTNIIYIIFANLFAPKARAQLNHLFNKLASCLFIENIAYT